jgi:hypothetical protein
MRAAALRSRWGRRAAPLGAALERRFAVDERALAALRVALGGLLLLDLALRARDLRAFYTDAGVLPRSVLAAEYPTFARLSLHAVSGEPWVQALLFGLAGALAVALLVGYRTRLATAGSLVLLVSLHLRNPLLLNAGDSLLRRLLFWSLFLPLGRRWSVDAARDDPSGAGGGDRRVVGLATAALLVQAVLPYAVNAVFKLRGRAWPGGRALERVFALDQLTVLLGDVLGAFPLLLRVLGWLWLALLTVSGLLVVLTGRRRSALAGLFAAGHLGMLVTLRLGPFPLVSVASLLPFLHPGVWDRVERAVAPLRARLDATSPAPTDTSPGGQTRTGRWPGRARTALLVTCLAGMLWWNAATLGYADPPAAVTDTVDPEAYAWDMFAPEPRSTDGWYVVDGRLSTGERVDPFRGGPVRFDRPPDPDATFPSHRWLVYLLELQRPAGEPLRPAFGDYLCDRWNDRHATDLSELTVYYVRQPVGPAGPGPTERVALTSRRCAG